MAYADSFTAVGSIVAQFLLAKKYIENWILWIIVDIVAIAIYVQLGLYYTAFLFLVYIGLCIFGWISWTKARKKDITTLV